jgi:hypothetical protein
VAIEPTEWDAIILSSLKNFKLIAHFIENYSTLYRLHLPLHGPGLELDPMLELCDASI